MTWDAIFLWVYRLVQYSVGRLTSRPFRTSLHNLSGKSVYSICAHLTLEAWFTAPRPPRVVPRLPRKLEPPVTPGELSRKIDDEQVSRIRV